MSWLKGFFTLIQGQFMLKRIGSVTVENFGKSYLLHLHEDHYQNGRVAIVANTEDGDMFGRLTVNIPDSPQRDGEIFVKTWSENKYWVPQVLIGLPEIFRNTGEKAQTGFVDADVWKYTPDA